MERKYSAKLIIDVFRMYGWICGGMTIDLFREDYDHMEEEQYDFQDLIKDYSKLDSQTTTQLRKYILNLLTLSEVHSLEEYLKVDQDLRVDYNEIIFPISSIPDPDSEEILSDLFPSPPTLLRGKYVFNQFDITGYYNLRNCKVFDEKTFKSFQEKKQCINRMLCNLELQTEKFVEETYLQGLLLEENY